MTDALTKMDADIAELHQRVTRNVEAGHSVNNILRFLDADHENEPVRIMKTDEIAERLQIVQVLKQRLAKDNPDVQVEITALAATLFLTMDMETLRQLEVVVDLDVLWRDLGRLKSNVKLFQVGWDPDAAKGNAPSSKGKRKAESIDLEGTKRTKIDSIVSEQTKTDSVVSNTSNPQQTAKAQPDRNATAKNKCKQLHGNKCIITTSEQFEVCHVLPYSMYNTPARQEQVQTSVDRLFHYFGSTRALRQLIREEKTLDRYWNLVPLSKTLHSAWGDARCAFECLRVRQNNDKWEVVLKFHWLNLRTEGKPEDPIPLDIKTMSGMVEKQYPEYPKDGRNVFYDPDGTRLRSGDIIRVQMPNKDDACKMQTVFNAQWVALRIAAMSGAALDPELPVPHDIDDRDPDSVARVTEWLDSAS